MTPGPLRPGELVLPVSTVPPSDPGLMFIGRIASPWRPGDCPKNLREARARGGSFAVLVDPAFRPGLMGLTPGDALIVLCWMAAARRDLLVQVPAHRPGPAGTFALRSPARPNPIALAVTRLLALDPGTGRLVIDAIDAFDGTPVLDLKPWLPGVDIPPEPSTARPHGEGECR